MELLEKIKQTKSRQEIAELIQPLKANDLRQLAKEMNIPISLKGKDKEYIKAKIISWCGIKIDNDIISKINLKEA